MNWLDRVVIRAIAPGWALKRAHARRVLAAYEAAETSRLRKDRKDKRSANAQNRSAAHVLRDQARHLDQNYDIAAGALDVLVNNTIGSGIAPEPQVLLTTGEPAEEFNRKLLRLWEDWIHSPEVTRQLDYYSLQRLAARTVYRDGEAFGQRLSGRIAALDHNTAVPFSLEMLEPDFVPYDLNEPQRNLVQGVQLNAWGQPLEYRVYKTHPGDDNGAYLSLDTKAIPASRMIHVKMAKRLHQVRGVSVFASVINRFDDVKEIDESERVAARVAAAMAAYIKKGSPDVYSPEDHPLDSDGTRMLRSMEMVPGMIFDDLAPGEEIGTIASNRPNNALIPFRADQMRSAAGGIGTSYSSLSKNYNGTYSAQRQELVETHGHYRAVSAHFIYRFCQPVWDGFVDAALASLAVNPRGVDMTTVYDASHTVPPMPWIDPLKESQANQIDENRGYKSRSRIIRERGLNPDQINQEIKRDQAEAERLGLKLGGPEKAAADQASHDADEAQAAADQRAAMEREAADARTAQLVKAVLEQAPPVVNVTTGAVTVEPAQVHAHVAPAAVTVEAAHVEVPAPTVNITTPEPVVNLEATVQAPVVNVAAPQVDVHMPERGPQTITATKLPDGTLRAEVHGAPKH
jgi:lambda family phage portal protein